MADQKQGQGNDMNERIRGAAGRLPAKVGDMNAYIRGESPGRGPVDLPRESVQEGGSSLSFERWLEAQTDDVKALVSASTKNLEGALRAEREDRGAFQRQIRELARSAKPGSEAEKQLTELADQGAAVDRRTNFYEAAHAAGVKNLKLALAAAEEADLVDAKGKADFDALKLKFPELFQQSPGRVQVPHGSAGAGLEGQRAGPNMNAFIRRGAGLTEHPIPPKKPI